MSSKGWGLSSADVGVFTNHQSRWGCRFKSLRWFNGLRLIENLRLSRPPTVETVGYQKFR